MQIRGMTDKDWKGVAQVYEEGIRTGCATFETRIPSYESWSAAHLPSCRLVAEEEGVLLGWAALSAVSSRCVYGGVAEVSVYVGSAARNRGVGKALMKALIEGSENEGIWSLQSGIFPENRASIELHKKMGFRYIGKRERIGRLHGVWKDNLLFERRSTVVGVE